MCRPLIQRTVFVAGGDLFDAAHQSGVDEIAGEVGQRGEFRRVGENGGDRVLARQFHISRAQEAGVAHLQHVAQRSPVQHAGQRLQEGVQVVGIEFSRGRQLPQYRAQPVAHFLDAAVDETVHALAAVGQRPTFGDIARRFQREHETRRRGLGPLGVGGRLLRAVISTVDLDGAQVSAGVIQLQSPQQVGRIEIVAPGRIHPAAHADADGPVLHAAGGDVVRVFHRKQAWRGGCRSLRRHACNCREW